jgi:hypothetical protein
MSHPATAAPKVRKHLMVPGQTRAAPSSTTSGAVWSIDPLALPADTRRALETDGRRELLKVLGHDDPPRVIRCVSTGCTYPSAAR